MRSRNSLFASRLRNLRRARACMKLKSPIQHTFIKFLSYHIVESATYRMISLMTLSNDIVVLINCSQFLACTYFRCSLTRSIFTGFLLAFILPTNYCFLLTCFCQLIIFNQIMHITVSRCSNQFQEIHCTSIQTHFESSFYFFAFISCDISAPTTDLI